MGEQYTLKETYIQMGFNLTRFGEKAIALTYKGKVIFAFNSDMDFSDGFFEQLCDSYLLKIDNS
jgi:hypothetical protein